MGDSSVHNSSFVDNVKLGENSIIYRDCRVNDTVMGSNTFIGDNSVVKFCSMDDYSYIARNSMVQYVSLGKYSYCGMRSTLLHCVIGKYCSISWNCTIGGAEHNYNLLTTHSFVYDPLFHMTDIETYNRFDLDCSIGNDVWIGSGAIILRGVHVSDGAVIGAGTVVTKDVPPYSIVCGNPGRIIKYRFDNDTIELLLKLKWWDFEPGFIKENMSYFCSEPSAEGLRILMDKANKHNS